MVHRRIMKIYLSGPMSSHPIDFNFPAFHEAAAALRADGHEVISPAELDEADDALGVRTWAEYLKRDIPELLKCNAIAMLPGYEASKGARLELHIASELGFEVIILKPRTPLELAELAAEERE
jgi:hypothetical protein